MGTMDCMSGLGAQPWLGQVRAVGGLGCKGHDPAMRGRAFSFVALGRFLQWSVVNPTGTCLASEGFLTAS